VNLTKFEIVVEVGILGGSSVYPFAHPLKRNNKGTIYAIDPWSYSDSSARYSDDTKHL
jgi:hypothetical protein